MSENNFTIKATARNQSPMQSDGVFNQHKFISDIYECEKKRYILVKRIDELDKELLGPQRPAFKPSYEYDNYCKEVKKKKSFPQKVEPLGENAFIDALLEYTPVLGIVGAIVGVVFDFIFDSLVSGLIVFIIAIIIGIVIGICKYVNDKTEYNNYLSEIASIKTQNADIVKYNNERYKYWENERHKRYVKTIDEFEQNTKPIIEREQEQVLHQLCAVYDTLEMLYNLRVNGVLCLHPNYQGLVPISIIYGYFDTGRCSQLQGHEGAYNLYEDEKMKGMIINKLDIVSQQLGQLNSTMVYVGQAIEECNERLSDLESASNRMISSVNNMNSNVSDRLNGVSNQMSAIEANTANSAYYAEVGARMSTFNTVYNLLSD